MDYLDSMYHKASFTSNFFSDTLDITQQKKNMSSNMGQLKRDIIGGSLEINGDTVLRGTTRIQGDLRVNGDFNLEPDSPYSIVKLSNADFESGTYRIKKGGTYVLTEDIVFDPTFTREDLPPNKLWFAGITVETNSGVVIDGNGFDLKVSSAFATNNLVSIWTAVCLGNNTFSGALFGLGGSRFSDTSSYESCSNVSVKNLKVTYSTHFGIIGNSNEKITIECCELSNCQIGCCLLLGLRQSRIERNIFIGNSVPIPLTSAQTTIYLLQQNLQSLVQVGVPGASTYLNNLNIWVAANPSRLQSTQLNPTTSYGLFVYGAVVANFRLPTTALKESIAEGVTNGRPSEEVTIVNNIFKDFTTTAVELIGVGTNIAENLVTNLPFTVIPLSLFGLFGVIEWQDIFPSGIFAPNAFASAIAFWCNFVYPSLPPPISALLPANIVAILTSILTSNAGLFNANAAPIVSIGGDTNPIKGLFTLRTVALKNSKICNNRFTNINSTGPLPVDPTTLPGYGSLSAPQAIIRSRMNDVWMISLELNNNVEVNNNECDTGTTDRGFYFAIDSLNENGNVAFVNNSVKNISAPNATVYNTIALGKSFAFRNSAETSGIAIINGLTQNITSASAPVLYPAASATVNLINAISI